MKPINSVRVPLGLKIILVIVVLLLSAVFTLEQVSTQLYTQDARNLILESNSQLAQSLALRVRASHEALADKARILGSLLLVEAQTHNKKEALVRRLLDRDTDLLALFLFENQNDKSTLTHVAIRSELGTAEEVMKTGLAFFALPSSFTVQSSALGDTPLARFRLPDRSTAIAIGLPFVACPQDGKFFTYTLVAISPMEKLQALLSDTGLVHSFVVDRNGKLYSYAKKDNKNESDNLSHLEIVSMLLEGSLSNGQTVYTKPDSDESWLGAFRTVGFGGLGVITEVPEEKALQPANRVKYRTFLIAVIILSLAVLVGYFFSQTLSLPLNRLVHGVQKISEGQYDARVPAKSRDEIALLAKTFNEMAQGLEEREKVKKVLHKFHSKEIAEKMLSGEVKLGGSRQNAFVLFTDLRDFTSLSEEMKPEAVLEMINEYMTRMVSIIRKYGGTVDKYIGDAIMALWGVPEEKPQDAYRAVFACLQMRAELTRLNRTRLARRLPELRMGMGLNFGPVIAGNMGSVERMEYTVIGDTVNMAARIEAITKELSTDLLIPKSVLDQTKGAFLVESCGNVQLKGKQTDIELFQVLGYKNEKGESVRIDSPFSGKKAA